MGKVIATGMEASAEELAVMKFAVRGAGLPVDCKLAVGIDWKQFYAIAMQQNVIALVADGIGQTPPENMPFDVKMQIVAGSIQVENAMAKHYETAKEVADWITKYNERMVVLKGLAFGSYYPKMLHRHGGDLDCFFPDDFNHCIDILRRSDIKVDSCYYRHYNASHKGLKLECHQFCTPIRGNSKMKRFERILQDLLKQSSERIEDTSLLRPCALFNALFFTSHAASHFKVESLNLRYLTDWAVILRQNVDWVKFRDVCAEYDLLRFADAMTKLAVEYMSVPLPKTYALPTNDNGRATLLLDFILHDNEYVFNHKSKLPFGSYLSVGLGIFKRKSKTSYFFKESSIAMLCSKVYGLIFDSTPSI